MMKIEDLHTSQRMYSDDDKQRAWMESIVNLKPGDRILVERKPIYSDDYRAPSCKRSIKTIKQVYRSEDGDHMTISWGKGTSGAWNGIWVSYTVCELGFIEGRKAKYDIIQVNGEGMETARDSHNSH